MPAGRLPGIRRRAGWTTAAAVALAILIAALAQESPATPATATRATRELLLAELRPVVLENCTLKRVGSRNDGGYLMCENLMGGLGSAYSYGVGPNDEWGCQVATRYQVPVHQYDCFDPTRPVCRAGKTIFHDECIGARPETVDARRFDTLARHIAANGDGTKRLIVKIDIEGGEWDLLLATPDAVLARIDQMPMELHGVDERRIVQAIRKLKRTFWIANLHFNNWACSADTAPLPGRVYQVLLVNKRIGVHNRAAGWAPMSAQNTPDSPQMPDCQLN